MRRARIVDWYEPAKYGTPIEEPEYHAEFTVSGEPSFEVKEDRMTSDYWLGLAKEYKPKAQYIWDGKCKGEYPCDRLNEMEIIEELACFAEWLSRKWKVQVLSPVSQTGSSTKSTLTTPDE